MVLPDAADKGKQLPGYKYGSQKPDVQMGLLKWQLGNEM